MKITIICITIHLTPPDDTIEEPTPREPDLPKDWFLQAAKDFFKTEERKKERTSGTLQP